MYIDIGERLAGKQGGPGLIIYGPHRIAKNAHFFHIWGHIWKTGGYFVSLLYICELCDEILLPLKFGNPGFDVRAPQDRPKYDFFFFSYFGFELKKFLSAFFLISHVHRYGWEDSLKARKAQSDYWSPPPPPPPTHPGPLK